VRGSFGKGITFASEDETFTLTVRARLQARASTVVDPSGATDATTELQIRRARLLLTGNAGSRSLRYYLQLGFSNLDTEPDLRLPLRDAYVTWLPLRDVNVKAGQMKVPFGRQRVISSSSLQFADRSIAVIELNLDRDVGLQVFSRDLFGLRKVLGYQLGVFGGDGRNRLASPAGLLYVARLELTPFGEFDDYVEADIPQPAKPRLVLAAGVALNQQSPRPRSTTQAPYVLGGFDYHHAEVDATLKWAGFSLAFEWLYRNAPRAARGGVVDARPLVEYSRSATGYHVQAGQMLGPHVEIAARYSDVWPLPATDPTMRREREVGGGLSYYFIEHALKLQADYFWLASGRFADGRHQARVQMQVYF